ncbi:MAG: AIR carboxylase family protein [Sediminibacterium sp.]|nr:AIR carboxylase family protein [Sediminibacterium sp.]
MATQPIVGIIMGSDSDLPIMQQAADMLTLFNIPFELTIVSAHLFYKCLEVFRLQLLL